MFARVFEMNSWHGNLLGSLFYENSMCFQSFPKWDESTCSFDKTLLFSSSLLSAFSQASSSDAVVRSICEAQSPKAQSSPAMLVGEFPHQFLEAPHLPPRYACGNARKRIVGTGRIGDWQIINLLENCAVEASGFKIEESTD